MVSDIKLGIRIVGKICKPSIAIVQHCGPVPQRDEDIAPNVPRPALTRILGKEQVGNDQRFVIAFQMHERVGLTHERVLQVRVLDEHAFKNLEALRVQIDVVKLPRECGP